MRRVVKLQSGLVKLKIVSKALRKWTAWGVVALGLILCAVVGLSSFHYKTVVLDPVTVWHGVNLGVRSLLSGQSDATVAYDKELLDRLSAENEAEISTIKYQEVATPKLGMSHNEVKNLVAENQARNEQLRRDMDRLNKTNEQLLNSKSTLDSLNQDFSNVAAYQQQELARRQAIEEATAQNSETPTEADANALMAERKTKAQTVTGIPQKVLTNVQTTTGISPEEINKLMNQ